MREGEIKVGDVVTIASGGHKMTVSELKSVEGVDLANCVWWGTNSQMMISPEGLHYEWIPVAVLRKV